MMHMHIEATVGVASLFDVPGIQTPVHMIRFSKMTLTSCWSVLVQMGAESIHAGFSAQWITSLFVKAADHRPLQRLQKLRLGLLSVSFYCIKVQPVARILPRRIQCNISPSIPLSIPVPKVHCAFIYKDQLNMVMSRLKGDMVYRVWKASSNQSKTKVLRQLKQMLNELQTLPPSKGMGVASINGNSVYHHRINGDFLWGPIETIHGFQKALLNGILSVYHSFLPEELNMFLEPMLSKLGIE